MSLLGLPNELLQAITVYCGVEGEGLLRTNKRLHENAEGIVWQSAIEDPETFTRLITRATESGNLRMMRKAATYGADFDLIHPVQWPQNMTELKFCTDSPSWEEGEELSQFWASPLHLAVYHNHYDTVEWLITVQGVDVDAPGRLICDCKGLADHHDVGTFVFETYPVWTALHFAICRKHDSIARLLLSRNATTSVMLPATIMSASHIVSRCTEALRTAYTYSYDGLTTKMTALHVAASHGTKSFVTHLVQSQGMDINERDATVFRSVDYQPIHYAIFSQDETMIEHLLSLGAHLNGTNGGWYDLEDTPLCCAVSHMEAKALTKLLDAGAKTWFDDENERRSILSHPLILSAIDNNLLGSPEEAMAAVVKLIDKTLQDYAADNTRCLPIEGEIRDILEIMSKKAPKDWNPSLSFSHNAKRLFRDVLESMMNPTSSYYVDQRYLGYYRREKPRAHFATELSNWKAGWREDEENIEW